MLLLFYHNLKESDLRILKLHHNFKSDTNWSFQNFTRTLLFLLLLLLLIFRVLGMFCNLADKYS